MLSDCSDRLSRPFNRLKFLSGGRKGLKLIPLAKKGRYVGTHVDVEKVSRSVGHPCSCTWGEKAACPSGIKHLAVPVHREEIYARIQDENRMAAKTCRAS